MSDSYEEFLFDSLKEIDSNKFRVLYEAKHFFICGGRVDVKSLNPQSYRDRFLKYTAIQNTVLHDQLVLAEEFKDYFQAHSELQTFENDIASVSSLILIFLESPGSLVEFGMFSNLPDILKKLLVVVPLEKHKEDSFIHLGPLSLLSTSDTRGFYVYDFNKGDDNKDYEDDLSDLCSEIDKRVKRTVGTEKFNHENQGHLTSLVYQISKTFYPIIKKDFSTIFDCLSINIDNNQLDRSIYLLKKLNHITTQEYSSYTFYFPKAGCGYNFLDFNDRVLRDETNLRVNIGSLLSEEHSGTLGKRRNALKKYMESIGDQS